MVNVDDGTQTCTQTSSRFEVAIRKWNVDNQKTLVSQKIIDSVVRKPIPVGQINKLYLKSVTQATDLEGFL